MAVQHARGGDGPARLVAMGAALVTALLYILVGAGVLPIGRPADGSASDLVGFGVTLGGTFIIIALLSWRVRARVAWVAIAAIQLITIVGYFAAMSLREPPIELWGLMIKACQAVVLLAAGYVLLAHRPVALDIGRERAATRGLNRP